ncbi:23S rRNA (uracil(1939)-C(5))-methyltransferase RlmD [Aliiglaciecola sp. M165]|uniref:23S rRNA (uracil(1939)-C(5))-methyltransferase RlmD n=1 Tax=Aliiglaciecola sp. M165 TaxID=2593649 RepID=UPI001181576F|nr:23S rRNA (uracil(1939)-C(5))-methyltransferase RlmD [Aliiglaciecola sp. M165]TRY31914.1 23S rRNA (uracil(1939)-C(5))-methyltransferase RlmD [Aliiglaciecola sp. M165]
MANLFKVKPSTTKSHQANQLVGKTMCVEINSLEHTGIGVVSDHQPVIFVEGALPGEKVEIVIREQKARFCRAELKKVIQASPARTTPFCQHFNQCGGCQTQHVSADSVCSMKQTSIEQLILHTPLIHSIGQTGQRKKGSLSTRGIKKSVHRTIGDLVGQLHWSPTLYAEPTGYRRKTRLSVDARNRQDIKLGFRQSGSKQIFSIQQCQVLTPALQHLIEPLQNVMATLDNPSAIGHVSMFEGSKGIQVCLRVTKSLNQQDKDKWAEFSRMNQIQLAYEDNHHQITLADLTDQPLVFDVPNDIELAVNINDFVQVNDSVNRQMIEQACNWLSLDSEDNVLDLFCGIGNFSLPMASQCKTVVGVEGVAEMVQRATQNALKNNISNCQFWQADLNNAKAISKDELLTFNKVLLDPARDGAGEAVDLIVQGKPSHILYVSCNPATFARDTAKLLAHKYQISKIGLMDMFPQTAHTELMALFVPKQ